VLDDIDIRVTHRERCNQRGQNRRYPLVCTEYQPPRLSLREVRDVGIKLINRRKNLSSSSKNDLAGWRRGYRTHMPINEKHAKLDFKPFDLFRKRRLRYPEFACRSPETAQGDNFVQVAQLTYLHDRLSLSRLFAGRQARAEYFFVGSHGRDSLRAS
jgi:hypothetical protein